MFELWTLRDFANYFAYQFMCNYEKINDRMGMMSQREDNINALLDSRKDCTSNMNEREKCKRLIYEKANQIEMLLGWNYILEDNLGLSLIEPIKIDGIFKKIEKVISVENITERIMLEMLYVNNTKFAYLSDSVYNVLSEELISNLSIDAIQNINDKGEFHHMKKFDGNFVLLLNTDDGQFMLEVEDRAVCDNFIKELKETFGMEKLENIVSIRVLFNTQIVTDCYGDEYCIISELCLDKDSYSSEGMN